MKILALLFLVSVSAWALSDDEIRSEVSQIISERHPKADPQANKDMWIRLGTAAPAVIIQMYKETDSFVKKIKLIQGLAWYDDRTSIEFIKDILDEADSSVLRVAALKTYGLANGANDTDTLKKYLKSDDVQTRLAAAQALQVVALSGVQKSEEAQKALDQYQATETQAWVKNRLESDKLKIEKSGVIKEVPSKGSDITGMVLKIGKSGVETEPFVFQIKSLTRKKGQIFAEISTKTQPVLKMSGRMEMSDKTEIYHLKFEDAGVWKELVFTKGPNKGSTK